jgi:hypothetical protein
LYFFKALIVSSASSWLSSTSKISMIFSMNLDYLAK